MSAKSWLSVVLTGAAALVGSVMGANTPQSRPPTTTQEHTREITRAGRFQ